MKVLMTAALAAMVMLSGCSTPNPLLAPAPTTSQKPVPVKNEADLVYLNNNVEITLDPSKDSPIWIQFQNSEKYRNILKRRLESLGFKVVDDSKDARRSILMGGFIELRGGPKLGFNGAIHNLGVVLEKSTDVDLKAIDSGSGINADLGSFVVAGAILQQGLIGSVTDFGVTALSEVAARGINKAIFNDPRGPCVPVLNNCEDWNKVRQLVTFRIATAGAGRTIERRYEGYALAFQEDNITGMVISRSMNEAFKRVQIVGHGPLFDYK